MELWKQCAQWLIQCRVLPPTHRVTWSTAQVCDLAQALRDGVLLCQLLNNLLPHAVNLKEINLRPQMSQFLCLKNIRTFLSTCSEKFGLRKNELFEAFDLFEVRDFGKVIDALSILSWTQLAKSKGFTPFPTEDSAADDDIYSGLSDQIDDTVDEDDDLYDCVEMDENEGDEIYEDLMKMETSALPQKMAELDKRNCCLQEIWQTEQKYTNTLESICLYFMKPLQRFLKNQDMENIFINLEDLLNVHRYFLEELKNSISVNYSQNLYQVFIKFKERFLLYGQYCSQVEFAAKHLDQTACAREDIRMKLEECSTRANNGRFSLRDLLMVPMQRVLKYPLLLQELAKHTQDEKEKKNLRLALDAMKDLAQCVNEVKRDNETLKQITHFQLSIENLWTHMFLLIENHRTQGFELFFKTRDLKKKWLEQFEMALSNIYPGDATANGHEFQMFTFEETASCKTCQMLLRGLFFQGYRCTRCRAAAHKECLGRMPACGKSTQDRSSPMRKNKTGCNAHSKNNSGLTKMEACQEYYGLPPPPVAFGPALHLNVGEIVELTKADAEQNWWEGRNTSTNEVGCFPYTKVKPYISSPLPDLSQYLWYAGPLERREAEEILGNRSDGTFLVRQRVKDAEEFAISMKFNEEIKHIKITPLEGLYRITEKKAFKGLIELVEFYEQNSLKDCFKSLDTTLRFPFKEPEKRMMLKATDGSLKCFGSAKARYDFCARDRTELSLKEGDLIKIINKKGHQGWWKGEVYGKIGWFPANYVEEDYSDYC
ncbi:proto-oncogene vav isoform X2 [Microcaecilia unicolor]|uniref:Proto-oncogene vav isoform X2 n=1 Tax=Microcaecilia unicolor TaxID=1415580 RepID=A0A6P7XQP1_9AMPH|nr:proto-oncogene vav isoform X2 [Microcaecilia unicolor]